jgi:regulator of sirC expression with transglutaminase-like and TPR domain
MKENELKALVSLLDEDDKEILHLIEKQIYTLGSQMIPYLELEWQQQKNQKTQKRIEDIVHQLRFEEVLAKLQGWKETEQDDLLKGLWIIATYQYPSLELKNLKIQIEQLYYEVWQVFREDLHPHDTVRIMNSIIFGKLRFKPNPDFQAINNSMINMVLETRMGNPIALCCVYMLVAAKFNLPIYGVNLPNIFILTYKSDLLQFYINPTNKGIIFNKSDIDNYIEQLNIQTSDVFYEPCSHIDMLKRILRNLAFSFEKIEDQEKKKEVKRMLGILEK